MKNRKIGMVAALAWVLILGGCEDKDENPKSDHPKQSEHPKSEHPK